MRLNGVLYRSIHVDAVTTVDNWCVDIVIIRVQRRREIRSVFQVEHFGELHRRHEVDSVCDLQKFVHDRRQVFSVRRATMFAQLRFVDLQRRRGPAD